MNGIGYENVVVIFLSESYGSNLVYRRVCTPGAGNILLVL